MASTSYPSDVTGDEWAFIAPYLTLCELPWRAMYRRTRRWIRAVVLKTIGHDLRAVWRVCQGKRSQPAMAIIDSSTVRSAPESGARSGYGRTTGSETHKAIGTLRNLLTVHVTLANEQ